MSEHSLFDDGVEGRVHIRTRSLPHVHSDRLRRRLAWFDQVRADPTLLWSLVDGRKTLREWAREEHLVREELNRREQHEQHHP